MAIRPFEVWDYLIFAICLGISAGIGIYHAFAGGGQKTTEQYYYGNRQMRPLPVALSLLVTYQSSIFLLGYPGEMYIYGSMFWLSFIGVGLGFFLIAILVVPLLHPLEIRSVFQYLEKRYNHKAPRKVASFLSMILYAIFMGLVLYGPAITLETVTNFPLWGSMVLVAVGGIFYTSVGGFKAVIWADVFQSIIILIGLLSLMIKGILSVGGLGEVWRICEGDQRIEFNEISADITVRHTIWGMLIGNTFQFFSLGFSQMIVQRITSTPTQESSKRAFIFENLELAADLTGSKWLFIPYLGFHRPMFVEYSQNLHSCFLILLAISYSKNVPVLRAVYMAIPGFLIYGSGACLLGLTTYAFNAKKQCDPLAKKIIRSPNQVLPYFVMDVFDDLPGMPGVFLAALFSASLSTLSSGLNSLPTITWEDFVKPRFPEVSEFKATLFGKILVLLYGGLSIGVAYLVYLIGGPIVQVTSTVSSCIGGPVCGMFIMGAVFKSANYKGSIVGCLTAFAFLLWIALGSIIQKYRVPWLPGASVAQCDADENIYYNGYIKNTTAPWSNATNYTDFALSTEPSYTTTEYSTLPQSQDMTDVLWVYKISYIWYTLIGILLCVVVGMVVSILTGGCREADEVEDKYLFFFRRSGEDDGNYEHKKERLSFRLPALDEYKQESTNSFYRGEKTKL